MQYGDFKILIIDEDTEVLHFLAHFLAGTGYKVETCASGKDCLESVKNFRPDILLLDNMVSGKGSTYLCQMFKSNPVYKSIYIILMSGSNAKPVHIAEGLGSGADGYLVRPVSEIELVARIEAACRLIHAEKSTRENEKKFRNLFELSQTGISMTSLEGRMTVNRAFASMLGYDLQELTQKQFQEITHPDDLENDLEFSRQIREGSSESARWEKRYLRKDGSVIWADINATIAKDDNGKPQYFITSILDITKRKLAERDLADSEAKFRSLFNTMAEGVALHEVIYNGTREPVDYRILDVNDAFTIHTGIASAQAIMKTATELYGSPPPFIDNYVKVALTGIPYSFEVFYERMDKYFSISVSSPGKDHFVTIFQDISHRKIAERELMESQEKYMELNLNLEKRVEERTAELTAANKELEAFAYTVSHDLRAPVRAIAGFTSILAEDHLPQLNDEGKRVFGIIQDNTRKMDQLIDDLLKFSRLSRAEMNVTLVNMNELAQLCFRELTAMDGLRSIEFSTGDLPVIKGDYAMLKQVWTNLISNAVKFTGHCESPVIKIDGKYHEGEFVYSIRDNGTGFNMQYSDKLFGVFQRLHSVKEFEGTGVGLAIVKRIILRHGGRIWATAEVGKGAEFLFTLMPR